MNSGINWKPIQNESIEYYSDFEKVFMDIETEHAPFKKKFSVTKRLRKSIVKRSELKSKYLKIQRQELFKSYKKQRNFCSILYKKEWE